MLRVPNGWVANPYSIRQGQEWLRSDLEPHAVGFETRVRLSAAPRVLSKDIKLLTVPLSSTAERQAVNLDVPGSNPGAGAFSYLYATFITQNPAQGKSEGWLKNSWDD